MNNKPFFSILMCNYNNAHFLREALDSVTNQTFADWELSYLDDCSTDNSHEIIKEYAAKEPRIKVYQNEKNKGYGGSIAKNIELANGKFGAILDPDDALTPDALETMHKALTKNTDLVGAYSQMYYCDENLKPEKVFEYTKKVPENTTYLEFGNMAMTHFFVFDREKFIAHGNVDTRYRNALDQDWYYKIEEIGKVEFVEKPLYYYRVSPTGLSQGIKKRFVTYTDQVEIAKNAADRRNWKGRRKSRVVSKVKALMYFAKYQMEKEEKKSSAKFSLLKSKLHQINSKI